MLQEKSCGAVVFLKQEPQAKYLLLKYSASHWDFVKGHVEPNENEKQTAIRELEEETGITDALFTDGFRETIEYFYHKNGSTIHKTVIFYLMQTHSEHVKVSHEHSGYVWLNYEQTKRKISFNNSKTILEKAQAHLVRIGIAKDSHQ